WPRLYLRCSADAELISFGVRDRDPAVRTLLSVVQDRRPGRDQALGLGLDLLRADPDVQVDAVLHRLRLRDQLEEDPLARAVGVPDRLALPPDQDALVGLRLRLGREALGDHLADEVLV